MNEENTKLLKEVLTEQFGATEEHFKSDEFKRFVELDRMPKVNDNPRIEQLADQAGMFRDKYGLYRDALDPKDGVDLEKFAELIKQAIYDEVKEELMADEMINIEPDSLSREYLKGCNGGIIDALCLIKNFGVDVDE